MTLPAVLGELEMEEIPVRICSPIVTAIKVPTPLGADDIDATPVNAASLFATKLPVEEGESEMEATPVKTLS